MHAAETRGFRECLTDCNLSKLHIAGTDFTQTNGHVHSRIDGAIIDVAWINKMPAQQALTMDPLFSYYSHLGLSIVEQRDTRKRSFKFYNFLGKHPDFTSKV